MCDHRRPRLATCRHCRDADATRQLAAIPAVRPWVALQPAPETSREHQPA